MSNVLVATLSRIHLVQLLSHLFTGCYRLREATKRNRLRVATKSKDHLLLPHVGPASCRSPGGLALDTWHLTLKKSNCSGPVFYAIITPLLAPLGPPCTQGGRTRLLHDKLALLSPLFTGGRKGGVPLSLTAMGRKGDEFEVRLRA